MLIEAIERRSWADTCGLYYPQIMMMPYALSRAYREGGLASDAALRDAMGQLLRDIIALQRADGSFPGGGDPTRDLATALAANTLLNIGAEVARDEGILNTYQRALARAVAFLVHRRQSHALVFRAPGGPFGDEGFRWSPGVFFAGTYTDLAQWRSEAYTTAIALEALVKFALAYDVGNASLLEGARLRIGYPDGTGAR